MLDGEVLASIQTDSSVLLYNLYSNFYITRFRDVLFVEFKRGFSENEELPGSSLFLLKTLKFHYCIVDK